MILHALLVFAAVVTTSNGAYHPCLAGPVTNATIFTCPVEAIVEAILHTPFDSLGNDIENIDSPCGKALMFAEHLRDETLAISCSPQNSDITGDEEDNEIDEPIDEPGAGDQVQRNVVEEDSSNSDSTQAPEEQSTAAAADSDPECYTREDGGDYFGTLSVTRSGYTCQMWSEKTPHKPVKKYRGYVSANGNPPLFPTHFGEHNYCRTLGNAPPVNPSQSSNREGPWCYTTDPQRRWEYCDVPAPSASC
ncbi:uncharacterized protein [Antedon mediterranea]|uniref:uncharacterized protein n=1 Tax=Antedon mediterranea TaxID=105859 RepID=UPI003AF7D54F